MNSMNRRDFLGKAAVTVGAATLATQVLPEANAAARLPKKATDRVKLGKTGLRPTVLGIGTGTIGWGHQSNQTRLGQEEFTRLVRHAYDSGIRFFDCADQYGSHPYLKQALKGIPRDQIVIQSKVINRDARQAKDDIERFRQELGTDYIDSLLIHVVTEPNWPERYAGVRDVFEEAKSRKVVKYHGCSCHTLGALKAAAAHPWVEVDFARINPKGLKMDASPDEVVPVLKGMRAQGKGVIGMKIYGEGDIKDPAERQASLKFAMASGGIDAMIIGFQSTDQIDDTLKGLNLALKELRAAA